jgi:hypothetical protein
LYESGITDVKTNSSGPHSETGNACHYVVPGLNSANPVDFFRIMRVTYRQLPQDTTAPNDLDIPVIYPFTYETFTPELVRVSSSGKQSSSGSQKERLESMNETFSKVIAFLQNSGNDYYINYTINCIRIYDCYFEEKVSSASTFLYIRRDKISIGS